MNKTNPYYCENGPQSATTIKHIWNREDDRWMYIEYNKNNQIIGLNFMQGDDYDFFKHQFTKPDENLTAYFKEVKIQFSIEFAEVSDYEFVNKCMWTYFAAHNN